MIKKHGEADNEGAWSGAKGKAQAPRSGAGFCLRRSESDGAVWPLRSVIKKRGEADSEGAWSGAKEKAQAPRSGAGFCLRRSESDRAAMFAGGKRPSPTEPKARIWPLRSVIKKRGCAVSSAGCSPHPRDKRSSPFYPTGGCPASALGQSPRPRRPPAPARCAQRPPPPGGAR